MFSKLVYYLYILRCSDGTLYTGITADIKHRLKQHNGVVKGGAKYTTGRRPVQVVYSEQHTSHKEAAQREYQVKKLTREKKEKLIVKAQKKMQ
jgi:putative endonuclease